MTPTEGKGGAGVVVVRAGGKWELQSCFFGSILIHNYNLFVRSSVYLCLAFDAEKSVYHRRFLSSRVEYGIKLKYSQENVQHAENFQTKELYSN